MAEFPDEILVVVDLDSEADRVVPFEAASIWSEEGPMVVSLAIAAVAAPFLGAFALPVAAVAAVETVTSFYLWRGVKRGALVMVQGDALPIAASEICRRPGARENATTPVTVVAVNGGGWWFADPAAAVAILASSWGFSFASGGSWLGCAAATACALALSILVFSAARTIFVDEAKSTVEGLAVLLDEGIEPLGVRLRQDWSGFEVDPSRVDAALDDATDDSKDGDDHARNA